MSWTEWRSSNLGLTGNMRYRVQRFTGRLVVQVEEEFQSSNALTGEVLPSTRRWRDAVAVDFLIANSRPGEEKGDRR